MVMTVRMEAEDVCLNNKNDEELTVSDALYCMTQHYIMLNYDELNLNSRTQLSGNVLLILPHFRVAKA